MELFGPNIKKMLANGDLNGLIAVLDNKNIKHRQNAAIAIGQLGRAEGIRPLIYAFVKETDASVKESLLQSLQKLYTAEALSPLVHLLADRDWRVQQIAGKLLAQLDYHTSANALRNLLKATDVDILINALGNNDLAVADAAANILNVLGDIAVPNLIIALASDRTATANLARILGWIRNPIAIDPLVKALGFVTTSVNEAASEALSNFGVQAVEPLKRALREGNTNARKYAARSLGKIAAPNTAEALANALSDKDASYEVANALAQLGKPATQFLLTALNDKSNATKRREACRVLGKLKSSETVEPLIKILNDGDKEVRIAACVALGEIGDAKATDAIIEALNDTDNSVREKAVQALGSLKQSTAVPLLILALGDSNYSVSYEAGRALENLNEKALADAVRKALGGDSTTLINLNDKRAIPALIQSLGNSNPKQQQAAIEALSKLGEEPLANAFSQALAGNPEPLAQLNDERALKPLLNILLNGKVKQPAAIALGKWQGKGYDVLLNYRDDANDEIRRAAITGIGNSGTASSVDLLVSALNDKSWTVAVAAATTLGDIGNPIALEPLLQVFSPNTNRLIREAAAKAVMKISMESFLDIVQKEEEPRVQQSMLNNLSSNQLLDFFAMVDDQELKFQIIEVLSNPDKKDGSLTDAPEIRSKIVEILLARFEDMKWDPLAAKCMINLIPETTLTDQLINQINQAMGFGYRHQGKYNYFVDTTTGDQAIKDLCLAKTAITGNILHIISKKPSVSAREMHDCQSTLSVTLDFAHQKQRAKEELTARGNPPYDVRYFING